MANPLDLWRGNIDFPFREFGDSQRLMDRFFGDYGFPRGKSELANTQWNPRCEIQEDKTHFIAKFDLPGVPKDKIKIDLHENVLTVSGERKEEKTTEDKASKQHMSEVFYGSFMRSFSLPTTVNAEKVEARYDNGVLSIHIPKDEPAKARQITIK